MRGYRNGSFCTGRGLPERESHLVAGLAARLQPLGVVPAAVDLSVLEEVDEIDQQLAAGGTLETLRVPTAALFGATGKHRDVSAADLPLALEKKEGFGWDEEEGGTLLEYPRSEARGQNQRGYLTVVGWELVQQLLDPCGVWAFGLCIRWVTCSGLSPGGTHAYSSEAQPESSSEMECLWKSDTSFVIIFSSWPGTERTACSSRTHLQ
ncbi:hypothetical protein EYF80_016426 [Liparis tanakae]|uniref:Uncharacterized protein n=1 Tax=Liparis tanakae TaxID=230148 RepID=A0A4Z2I7Z5_9TELE|nr:hypothetical protein EYF80_016426 [Liparis tanakae]